MRRIRLNLSALRARRFPRLLRPGLSAAELLDSPEALTLTRRELLGWAGAAAMTLPLPATATDARPFQLVAGRKRVSFRQEGRDRWVIDTRRFAGSPKLSVSQRDGLIRVELKNARYPGTEIPADLVCELKRGVVGWQMHLRLAYGGFDSRTPFASWLEGDVPARSRVLIEGRACGLGSLASLVASGHAQAEFFPNWTLHLSGRNLAKLLGVDGGASSDSLAISLLSPGEASILSRPQEKRTLLAMNRGGRNWKLGPDLGEKRLWDLVASHSSFETIHIEAGEDPSGESCRALLAESRPDNPAFTFLPGAHFTGDDGAPFRLPLRNVRYAIAFDHGRDQTAFLADYDQEPTWLHAQGCSFEIGGAAAQPFEIAGSGGEATRIRCAPALRRIAAPLPGTIVEVGGVQEGTQLAFAFSPAGTQARPLKPGTSIQIRPQALSAILQGPSFSIEVTRPDDLLALKFDFFNLNLSAGLGGPRLVRVTPGQPAYVAVQFAPQHIVEAAFNEPEEPAPLPREAEPPIPARIAGPSRLAFLVPDSTQEITYSLDTLLDWSKFEQSVTPLATPPPRPVLSLTPGIARAQVVEEPRVNAVQKSTEYYKTVQPAIVQPKAVQPSKGQKKKEQLAVQAPTSTVAALAELLRIKEPELYQTAIEAPYRLILSPNYYAGWAHAPKAVEHGGRTELWHTRLGVRAQEGEVDERSDYYRTVRAVWSEDYQPVCPVDVAEKPPFLPAPPFYMSPTTSNRYNIVRLSADRSMTKADGKPYVPVAIQVNRLMLSALGAWLNVHGAWDPPESAHDSTCSDVTLKVEDWRHIAAMGRDQYVRVVERGYLFPFGHRAVKITLTERKFNRTPVGNEVAAYLRQRIYVLVREREKAYPAPGQPHPNGPKLPFQTVRIITLSTPALDPLGVLLKEDSPSAPRAFYPQVSHADFQFQMQGVDWEGRTSEFTAPLIFVDADVARNVKLATELVGIYASDSDPARRKRPFSGQKVAYAKNDKPGDTAFETNSITFAGESADVNATIPTGQAYFYPAMEQSDVRIATVEQLTGAAATTRIGYHDSYLGAGLDSAANKGQVFAKLLDSVPLAFGAAGATSDKVGGLLTPTMDINGLSRSLGPVAGDLAKMVAGSFDPKDIFKDLLNATLLGDISLQDVIAAVADFSGALEKVPKFITSQLPNAIETTFTWQAEIQNVSLGGDEFFVVTGDKTKALTLSAKLTKHLDAKPPSYEVNGSLKQFEIHLVPSVMPLLVVGFNEISFSSVNGKKPDFSVDMGNIQFTGPLTFINTLKDLIPLNGFKDPPSLNVTSEGIEVGYSLGLPPVGLGVFSLSNLSLGAQLNVYFTNKPISFEFDFCTEDQPFLLTVSMFGGGGFFGLTVTPHGVARMAGGFDFGGSFSLNLGVASGGVHLIAGVSYTYDSTNGSKLEGYLKCGGSLEVLCIITVSVEFDMSLTYYSQGDRLHGRATLTVEISILFFSASVHLTVERDFAGSGGEHAALPDTGVPYPLGPTPVGFADQMEAADWQNYCEAFA
jgi:hypothetical protein